MSVHRLVNVRVSEALSALRGACADFDKSINASLEGSFTQPSHEEHSTDEIISHGLKRRRTDNESETSQSEDNTKELKTQLAQCHAKIVALEAQNEMQVPLLHRESIQKDQRILELTKELEVIRNEKLTAVDLRTKMEEELKKERSVNLQKQQSLEREVQQLRMRIEDIETDRDVALREAEEKFWREKRRRLKEEETSFLKEKTLIETRTAKDEALNKLHLVEDTLQKKQEELDSLQQDHRRLAEEVSQLKKKIQDHEWASDLLENGRELSEKMKIMAQWETELNQLRKENKKLREDRMNVSLYQERLRILSDVEKSAEKTRERCAELQFDLNVSQQLNSEWETALRAIDPVLDSPEAVLKCIRKLQNNELCFLEENSKLKTEIALLRNEKKLEGLEEANSLKLLERRLRLVRKERDSYKAVLDSYESDVTINPASMATRRITQLEAILSEYRAIDSEFKTKSRQSFSGSTSVEIQTDITGGACTTSSSEQEENGYRIIHFKGNPLDVAHDRWIAELKEVDKENKILRAKVKALEEKGTVEQPGETTLLEFVCDDPRKLRADLEAANKRMEKILAAFKKTSKEFRQAVYCLTGYRIDMKSNAKASCCVLRHMYAESSEDQLEFEIGANGFLHLLGNDYSLRLKSLTSEYLEKMDSIPAFLSALTLQLFNSQTMVLQATEQPSMFAIE